MREIQDELEDYNVLNIYRFGSKVYGTDNRWSDNDFIMVVDEYTVSECTDHHYFTVDEFTRAVHNHDIQALECLWLSDENILKENIKFKFDLDLPKLRKSISTVSDGSWVKGKKKLIVASDYQKELGIKSLFHSLRIRDFGIQIALKREIYDYSRLNYILTDLRELAGKYERTELWDICNARYGSVYKQLRSEFVALCPKPSSYKQKKASLTNLLKKYNITNDKLSEDIIRMFGDKEFF